MMKLDEVYGERGREKVKGKLFDDTRGEQSRCCELSRRTCGERSVGCEMTTT